MTSTPTPRDLRVRAATPAELDDIARANALAVHTGIPVAEAIRKVSELPVLDAPVREDEPRDLSRRDLRQRTPFDIRVRMLDETALPVYVSGVVDWRWRDEGRLDVYAVIDDKVHRVESWGPWTAGRVSRIRLAVQA